MNSKRFIRLSLCLTLVLLLLVGTIQVMIDPLFQYHKPWFGMEPFIKNERYQDAGMAKTFDFENVIMGSSMSQNFRVKDYEELFGGKTIKLTMEGSSSLDWTYILDDLQNRDNQPKTVLLNLDPYTFKESSDKLEHELPAYLYDYNYCNDVNYWFNFQIINDFTVESVVRNLKHDLPDYNEAFVWTKYKSIGSEYALEHYERPEQSKEVVPCDKYVDLAYKNMELLTPYFDSMPDIKFIFFCSPFSMLFWDTSERDNSVIAHKNGYLSAIKTLTNYDNVSVYLWTDNEMLGIMSDLDYYADEAHYSEKINKLILERIANGEGLLNKDNYQEEVNKLFEYIETFDYESLFE